MLTKEQLLAQRFGVREHVIAGVGTIKVRSLTRGESLEVVGKELDRGAAERYLLSKGLVEPALTEADVKVWQDSSPAGEIQDIAKLITELSGLSDGAPKSGVPGDGDQPGS
jgi:hypothetical protein